VFSNSKIDNSAYHKNFRESELGQTLGIHWTVD